MSAPGSFFVPEGESAFQATVLTRGPWHDGLQHGGPPTGLVARAIERLPAEGTMRLIRLTVDLLRPVPIGPVAIETEIVRDGKAAQVVEARLIASGKLAIRASALRMRSGEVSIPAASDRHAGGALPHPDTCPAFSFPFFQSDVGYHTAMELRRARGTFGEGSLALWMRARYPLLPGEALTPFQRVAIAGDSGNGVSVLLDVRKYTFVNPDLTITVHRDLEGEWVGLDARTIAHPTGIGVAETNLHDARGPIGRGTQNLVVQAR